ncbi:hypothetical protein SKUN_001396 [Spiroplasma kunkelii CR2-3x]|uniref:Uncharacterized protein n=1 Tax=Spiroplasma kunkelii CR2-3x TaxID=273035 RepID=A0A0K2JIL3_SPIKU|nr:hypothetical protein [Spiroplasma kunkelii]ALA98263.1 hypothetical protein SKUN_001396 [Spiroplasma kunkelii CR2-3x]
MIKIGIDQSGTGTTGLVVYEDNKVIRKEQYYSKDWKCHFNCISKIIDKYYYGEDYYYEDENGYYIPQILNIEDCLYTFANSSKDRDDLLRLSGAFCIHQFLNWVSLVIY